MVQLSPTGIRNEFWRKRLLVGLMVPERYASVFVDPEVEQHPCGMEALALLLTGPTQLDPAINNGDCDWLRTTVRGVTFHLLVSCFAQGEPKRRGSDDFADDDVTTRVYACMLAD